MQRKSRLETGVQGECSNDREAFTIVELLVSIAVMAILFALLLPAVQAAREAARRADCRNRLHQIGLAAQNFESTHGFYPSNGWGYLWMGDPDRGAGPKQPGGWLYQILPYLDESTLHEIGRGQSGADKRSSLRQLAQSPLPLLKCPSRPGEQIGPSNPDLIFANMDLPPQVAKTDYAVNEGDFISHTPGGPATLAEGDSASYPWTETSKVTGVSFLRSRVRVADVQDGTSNTIFAGEKYVSRNGYGTAADDGHDQPLYSGVDLDLNRWTISTPLPDGDPVYVRRFGSAHAGGCHFALCDGSVQQISYLIDRDVYRNLGNRRDGNVNLRR